MIKTSSYYNYSKVLSYNAVYNFIVGGRGTGKTYGAKRKVLRDAIRNGDEFIYLRRYKTELSMAKTTFLADIQHEFPEWDFKLQGYMLQMAHIETRNDSKRAWKTIGYFVALVVGQNYKSVAFPNVKTIIFDEFIIEKGALHYLPDETVVFNNFFNTVDRYKDKTRVFFLANSVSITNPYFLQYGIDPNKCDERGFIRMLDTFVIVHFLDSKEFENEVYKTRFGRFIQGSEYADYAVGNEFSDNHDALLGSKSSKANYMFTLEAKSGTFSVWHDGKLGGYFCTQARPGQENILTTVPERMAENKTLVVNSDKIMSRLRTAWRSAKITFDGASTRNAFLEIFK